MAFGLVEQQRCTSFFYLCRFAGLREPHKAHTIAKGRRGRRWNIDSIACLLSSQIGRCAPVAHMAKRNNGWGCGHEGDKMVVLLLPAGWIMDSGWMNSSADVVCVFLFGAQHLQNRSAKAKLVEIIAFPFDRGGHKR
jgi:hypothetical protein